VVRAIFHMAAEGLADREVAQRTDLKKSHVAEILTNSFYVRVIRDGHRRAAVIDEGLWSQVQDLRAGHSRRHPGPVSYRCYVWSGLIQCRSCGRRIIGHSDRYRHTDACAAFRGAKPGGADGRGLGDSYAADTFDRIVPRALAHVSANAALIAEVEAAVTRQVVPAPNQFALARIRRDRQQATRRLETDCDVGAWKAAWDRLAQEEAVVEAAAREPESALTVAEVLADLRGMYDDAEPETKHRIAQALFDKAEVLGPTEVWLHPSIEAEERGWAAAMSGEFRVELRQTGRGERARASLTQRSPRFLMVNCTSRESLPATARSA